MSLQNKLEIFLEEEVAAIKGSLQEKTEENRSLQIAYTIGYIASQKDQEKQISDLKKMNKELLQSLMSILEQHSS